MKILSLGQESSIISWRIAFKSKLLKQTTYSEDNRNGELYPLQVKIHYYFRVDLRFPLWVYTCDFLSHLNVMGGCIASLSFRYLKTLTLLSFLGHSK